MKLDTPTAEKKHSLGWLNITQFLGALNDNVFQSLVIFFLAYLLGADKDSQASIMAIATAVFVVPFLLFSHAAGILADRYSKRSIIVAMKFLELVVMLGGLMAVCFGGRYAPYIMYSTLFIMCTQSAIFGPSKYGIIPELVPSHFLSKANSYLVGLTYLAIILGTFIPSFMLVKIFPDNFTALAAFCVIISGAGILTSFGIRKTPPAGGTRNFTPMFLLDIFKTLRRVSSDRELFLTIIGAAYFLFLGTFIKLNILLYGQQSLNLSLEQSGFLFPIAALGIGTGALLSGRLSGRNIEFGVVPIGAAGLTICCIVLCFINPSLITVLILVLLVGISSGLFIVPLDSFIQYRAPRESLGEIIACQNFLSFVGVALAACLLKVLTSLLHLSPGNSFLAVGLLTGVLAICAVIVLPDFLVRFIILIVTKTIYIIRVIGIENVPTDGPALLVPNHVTWVDALLLSATQQRRIRFIMARDIMNRSFWKPIFKLMHTIPISQDDPPRQIVESLRQAKASLEEGYLVCIFAEGALTRNGNMHPFKAGMERIVKGTGAPIIPIHIGGAWGSIFSYFHGRLLSTPPTKIPYPVSIIFGTPMPDSTTMTEVRQTILELSAQAYELKKNPARNIPLMFARTARRYRFHPAISDTTGKKLNFGQTLTASLALAHEIKKLTRNHDHVGILLPSSVAGVLANAAIALLGKTAVNLNFTASKDAFQSAIDQCGIKTIISSKAFIEKLEDFQAPSGTVYLEDIIPGIGPVTKLTAFLKAILLPARFVAQACRICNPDDTATIIFSSGSTAEPKGVMLSHHNIISNIEQINDVHHFNTHIGLCGILPFFHSFGYTVTLWAPLLTGARAVYHPNPVDGAKIAEIVRENKLNMLFTTPTFLLVYIRKADKEDFASLKTIITGAEKLKPRVVESFEKRFGIRPLEGYGATELSPVASVNLPNVEIDEVRQTGNKENSIGHPMPGIVMNIVDPETRETLPIGMEGMLMVKGPNVMKGYLNNPGKTQKVLRAGWYETGDMARMDDDGFVYIMDRMSRFSKIGGEMVPHMAIEERLMQEIKTINQTIFVTSTDDEKKGEQLVVLFTAEAGDAHDLYHILKNSDLPNLWKPRKDNFFKIDAIPTLGSGKINLKYLRELARGFVENKPSLGQKILNTIRDAL